MAEKKKFNIRIDSLTCDYFMETAFFLEKNNLKQVLNTDITLNIIKTEKHIINQIEHIKFICEDDCYFWIVNKEIHHELEEPSINLYNGTR